MKEVAAKPKKSNLTVFVVVLVVLVFGFFAYTYFSGRGSAPQTSNLQKVQSEDHVKWARDADNVLVEYADFQCPNCKFWATTFASFEATGSPDLELTKKTTFVFRHFPLTSVHKNALAAAYAAEAAAKQGKFWEMHDRLFETQETWAELADPKDHFVKLATDLNLDGEKFEKDKDSQEVKNKVEADIQSGKDAGVQGVSTFFLNGKKYEGFESVEQLRDLLKQLK